LYFTDKGPIIKPVEYRQLKEEAGKIETATSSHLYKVPMTQKYLEISNKSVCIDVFKQDESDNNSNIIFVYLYINNVSVCCNSVVTAAAVRE
jgi:hypothetical protein